MLPDRRKHMPPAVSDGNRHTSAKKTGDVVHHVPGERYSCFCHFSGVSGGLCTSLPTDVTR